MTHACHRTTESRDKCRYESRMEDRGCLGCGLRKPDPPRSRGIGWLDRSRAYVNEWRPKQ
jgi:hypothetical protein